MRTRLNRSINANIDSTPVWLRNMNAEQVQAIEHTRGPIAVLAQAGSGKTRALVHRLVRLIETGETTPDKILAVTFSKKAADEMSDRAAQLGVDARIGTWHSLCLQIIKEDQLPESRWTIDESNKAKYVMKGVIGYKAMNWHDADLNELMSFVSWAKAELIEANTAEAKALANDWFGTRHGRLAATAYELYERAMQSEQLLTFDDFLVVVWRHLSRNEDARSRWASRWDFLLQDEAQDANEAQITIAKLLAQDHRNYLIVGDPAQSIYGFRGSSPDHIMAFVEEWQAERVVMNKNYRSTDSVVRAANNVIRKAVTRLETDMQPMRGVEGTSHAVFAEDLDDEARKFTAWVIEGVETGSNQYSDYTCLFRTNAQSRAVEEALLSAKVPYVVVGGSSFYERKEVRDLLGYLRVASGRDETGENVRRCINAPFRYLGAKFVDRLQILAAGNKAIDWPTLVFRVAEQAGIQQRQRSSAVQWSELMGYLRELINNPPTESDDPCAPHLPEQVLKHILQVTGYQEWLEKEEGSEGLHNNPVSNVRELIRVASRFSSVGEFLKYIDKNIDESKKQRRDAQAGGNRVLLMSVHRSKGLEWPNVWVVGMNEGILPHARGDLEEERRLAYVAMTRARDNLRCSYVRTVVQGAAIRELPPSQFLIDSGLMSGSSVDGEVY